MTQSPETEYTPAQQAMLDVWQRHVYAEFVTRNVEDALATMTEDAYINNVPVMAGGVGKPAVREFYGRYFVAQIPPDIESTMISRTIGQDRIVEESIFRFTHSLTLDWFLPGVPPTGKHIEFTAVAVVQFRDGKIAHEHLYWDQASVLVQLGLIDGDQLPTAGVEVARRMLDPGVPMNTLIRRGAPASGEGPASE
ncbi:MAG TPA: nuclear transport factor 2 family protein [Kofleriaceae bacterium]|jgi:carboxymethylenebutenolidase|nr:nuclear transport factor 2 family protein [Kofleriaceae bacterium]